MVEQARATKKQQLLLEFVDGFIKEHDYGPSYREIMTALGYKSVSTVAVHVEALITKGFLERSDNSARSLNVVGRAENALSQEVKNDTLPQLISKKTDELLVSGNIEDAKILTRSLQILGYDKEADSYMVKIKEKASGADA